MTEREIKLLEKVKNTSPIYLYQDFNVNPGRKGKIMDIDDFTSLWEEFCEKRDCSTYDIFFEDYFKKDQKIQFDFENVEEIDSGELSCGVPWILYMAGGDWELPVYFFLYPDEKEKPRMYIPTKGNVFHKSLKAAYGSIMDKLDSLNLENENYVAIENIIKESGLAKGYNKKEIDTVVKEICCDSSDLYEELIQNSVQYNIDWMEEEFENRIIAV